MKKILKLLLFFLFLFAFYTNSNAIRYVGEGGLIPIGKTNYYKCYPGLTKIHQSRSFTFGANGGYKINLKYPLVCAKIGDGICKIYENEITSPNDCKGRFRILSVTPVDDTMVLKYSYKDSLGKNKRIFFEYYEEGTSVRTIFSDNTGKIIFGIKLPHKVKDGKKYRFNVYDFFTRKHMGGGGFTFVLHKDEGGIIRNGINGKCKDGLTLVPIKTAYDSNGNLIEGYDKICIKKNDGYCNTSYENKYNSPEDCKIVCGEVSKTVVDGNCFLEEVKDSNDCVIDYKIICETEGGEDISGGNGGDSSGNSIFSGCLDEEIFVCGKKNFKRKTYKNICFALKDKAEILYSGKCKIRDEKGCLVESYSWCSTLKRCLENTKECPNETYIPNISEGIKQSIKLYLDKFYKKIENTYNSVEEILKIIDKISKKIDLAIEESPKYKDILYFVIQEIEAKRIYFMQN